VQHGHCSWQRVRTRRLDAAAQFRLHAVPLLSRATSVTSYFVRPAAEIVQRVKGIYDDFVGYRVPSADEVDAALRESVVAVDANVLLNLYRYNQQTSEDLLKILGRLEDRLVVPHQAVVEFWRNRQRQLINPSAPSNGVLSALAKNERSVMDALESWAKQIGLEGTVLDELRAHSTQSFGQLATAVEQTHSARWWSTGDNPGQDGAETAQDGLLPRLETLLAGHVTDRPEPTVLAECIKEGQRRATDGEPPGYNDLAKADSDLPEGAAGDYLVWFQATREAATRDLDLVIVTSDEKDDWWWRQRSLFLGPRPELSAEYAQLTGRRLFMLRPRDLLAGSAALDVSVDSRSLEDADRARAATTEAVPAWTLEGLRELLERLDAQADVQAAVIRSAAAAGGRISREDVYDIGEYSDERMLRGFTRPARRVTADLQAEGVVAEGVSPILVALYPDGVKASYFRVPPEIPSLMARMDGGSLAEPD